LDEEIAMRTCAEKNAEINSAENYVSPTTSKGLQSPPSCLANIEKFCCNGFKPSYGLFLKQDSFTSVCRGCYYFLLCFVSYFFLLNCFIVFDLTKTSN